MYAQGRGYVITDPYRRPVGSAPSNDIPFVFKSSEEFPAGVEEWIMSRIMTGRSWWDAISSHVETEYGVPQLGDHHCQTRT